MNGQVYILKAEGQDAYKIGITCGKVSDRIKDLQTGNPCKIRHIYSGTVENEPELERYLHGHFKAQKMQGEWYKLNHNQLAEAIRIIQQLQSEHALKSAIEKAPIAQKTTAEPQKVYPEGLVIITLLMSCSEDIGLGIYDFVKYTLKVQEDREIRAYIRYIQTVVLEYNRLDLWEKFGMKLFKMR